MKEIRKVKYAALVIIIAMLSLLFFSCAGEQASDTAPAEPGGGADYSGEIEGGIEPEEPTFQIPEADFDGYTMRILAISDEAWAITDMDVEELIGEPVNDAIFTRNRQIEAALNITIQEIPGAWAPHDMLRRAVMADSDEYDVMFAHASSGAPLATQGLYLNLRDISAFNFDQPYWDQGALRSFELMNRLYFTTSDSNLMTNDAIWVLYFNKRIAQDMQLADPYQLVRDGQWTVDAMLSMARAAAIDLDGDGVFGVEDQWGIASHGLAFMMFFTCLDERLVRLDNNGLPFLVEPNERFIAAYAQVRNLMDSTAGVYLGAGALPGADFAHATTPFMNGRALFCAEVLGWSRTFREMTEDFGILPHPKLDEHQPTHLNATANTVPIMAIPITNPDPERTALFMDVMTALSATTVTPAYYTISLEGKFARDEDSVEMLDIIRANRVYDLAVIYNWGNFFSAFITHGMSPAGENPMTLFERQRDRVEAAIEATIDAFD